MRRATEWRSEYSDMSMRTMARSSSKRKSARLLASSVLPTPVGPRKRNEPVGRSGSETPARVRRTASDTARTASVWPMRRAPMCSSMCSSFSDSPSMRRPAGMPVHAEMTSAMSSAPTSSLTIGSSPTGRGRGLALLRGLQLLLERGDVAVGDLGGAGEVALALEPVGLHAQVVDLGLEVADGVEARLLGLPPGVEGGELLGAVGEVLAQPLETVARGGVGLLLEGELLHLQPVDGAAELVDLDGARVDLHAQPRGRLVDEVDRLVGQLAAA